jgi:CubicO group peptidase (beta-lactamase class C family)
MSLALALLLASARVDSAVLPLDEVKQNVAADSNFLSMSLGVVTDDGLVLTAGAPSDRIYRIGSVTKTFTGLLLLILRDEGKLSLDDPLTKYLPEAKALVSPTADSSPILLRHLVTHTSGLPRVGRFNTTDGHEVTEAEVLGALKGLKLDFAPGSRVSYSNLAMGLAGIVVKRVTKQPYREALKAKVLTPLGIKGAWSRAEAGDKLAPPPDGKIEWLLGPEEAAGGLYLSLDELAKFVQLELSAWPPRDNPEAKAVRRSTLRESQLRAGFSGAGGQGFGVNWVVTDEPGLGGLVWHTGSTVDYHSSVFMLPRRGLAVIALASGSDAEHLGALARAQLETLAKALPKPPLLIGAPARAGLERLKALWAHCDEAAMREALMPDAFNSLWPKGQCSMYDALRTEDGLPVAEEQVLESDELGHVKVRVRTEKNHRVDVAVWADVQPPHLLGGLLVKPVGTVGPPARAAIDRVKGLWAKCDEAAIKAALAPKYVASTPWKSVCDMFDGMRTEAGLPKSEELIEADGPAHARVRFKTERNRSLDVTVWAQPDAPHLMTGLLVKPAP